MIMSCAQWVSLSPSGLPKEKMGIKPGIPTVIISFPQDQSQVYAKMLGTDFFSPLKELENNRAILNFNFIEGSPVSHVIIICDIGEKFPMLLIGETDEISTSTTERFFEKLHETRELYILVSAINKFIVQPGDEEQLHDITIYAALHWNGQMFLNHPDFANELDNLLKNRWGYSFRS